MMIFSQRNNCSSECANDFQFMKAASLLEDHTKYIILADFPEILVVEALVFHFFGRASAILVVFLLISP